MRCPSWCDGPHRDVTPHPWALEAAVTLVMMAAVLVALRTVWGLL